MRHFGRLSSTGMNNLTNLNVTSRKMRKPLMERKRRARINRSLDELHNLLTETSFAAKGAKLEKADILEMTVQYLKQVKQTREAEQNLENALLERYHSGFERCAEEVDVLVEQQEQQQLGRKLHRHLQNCLERVGIQRRDAPPGEKPCSVLVQQAKDLKILPNGDVLLLLSASRGGERLDKQQTVWRPWW